MFNYQHFNFKFKCKNKTNPFFWCSCGIEIRMYTLEQSYYRNVSIYFALAHERANIGFMNFAILFKRLKLKLLQLKRKFWNKTW